MNFRIATYDDLPEMKKLYVETIRNVCNNDYDEEQISLWTSSVNKTERWNDLIKNQFVLLANENEKIVGYASLKDNNYIDFFYIHHEHQRKGIANKLLNEMENKAKLAGAEILSSDISITARPFFEKKGFVVIERQENLIANVILVNFKMTKPLYLHKL